MSYPENKSRDSLEKQKFREKSDGSIVVGTIQEGALEIPPHDYGAFTYPTATTEVITFKQGGPAGATVAVLTLTYTSSTKELLSSYHLLES